MAVAEPRTTGGATISDTAYDSTTWNGNTTDGASKNALRDEFEIIIASVSAKQNLGNYITSLTGDVVASGPGAAAAVIQAGVIVNSMISSSAAIALSKLAALTFSKVLVSDGSGVISASSITSATLAFLDATSSVQTQLNARLTNPLTILGDIIYATTAGATAALAGNTTATKKFLTQTGTGSASAAPGWNIIAASDLPSPTSTTLGGVKSYAAVSNQFLTSISTAGQPVSAQPAFTNVSGVATVAQTTIAAVVISASAIDWSLGNLFTKSIGSTNTTFTFSNRLTGQTIIVEVTATTGTVTWPTVKWPGGTIPTQTVSGTDVYTFFFDGTSVFGSAVQDLK